MKKLRIHYFQHVPFEGLGNIEEWIRSSGHSLTSTMFYNEMRFPEIDEFDWLIVMGGSMNVDDEKIYPWLANEKIFIRKAIDSGKIVIGICLGSQLISAALGAKVYRNKQPEIGWFDIELSQAAQLNPLFQGFSSRLKVFNWHGDTFDLPKGAIRLASSEATVNQGYIYNDKVLAMQFHLETNADSLAEMLDGGINAGAGKYIQSEAEIVKRTDLIDQGKEILFKLLDRMAEKL
jgi:GMP synthase-like glutamine amidotransferase